MPERYAFRPYQPGDAPACFRLFDANCPPFFAPGERQDLMEFLRVPPAGYEVALLGNEMVAAFGVRREAGDLHLRWIMVAPSQQGRGLGRLIMARVTAIVHAEGEKLLRIATSHLSERFFAKFGAREVARTTDGWGPGLHRVDLVLTLG
jgi:GNAT superfamily N-acetyltransferase